MRDMQTAFKKWEDMSKTCDKSMKDTESTVKKNMDSVWNKVDTVMKDVRSAFKKWEEASKVCRDSLKDADREVATKMGSMKTTVENNMEDIQRTFKNGMKDFPSTARDTVRDTAKEFEKLPNKISNALNGLYGKGQDAAQSFANGFKSVHIPTPHITVSSWTQHRAGDSTYSTPNFGVNWYKTGGLAYNPSVVGIGEAGPEAILPLESNKTMGMIADSILDNYSGGIDEDMIANAVAEGVVMAIVSNQQNFESDQRPINITVKLENDEAIARAAIRGQQSIDYRMNPTPRYSY